MQIELLSVGFEGIWGGLLMSIFWWLALLRLTIGHARQSYRSICYLDGFVYAGCTTCHISIWGWIFAFVVVIAEIRHLERCVTWEVYPLLDSVSLISHIEGIVKGVRGIGNPPRMMFWYWVAWVWMLKLYVLFRCIVNGFYCYSNVFISKRALYYSSYCGFYILYI